MLCCQPCVDGGDLNIQRCVFAVFGKPCLAVQHSTSDQTSVDQRKASGYTQSRTSCEPYYSIQLIATPFHNDVLSTICRCRRGASRIGDARDPRNGTLICQTRRLAPPSAYFPALAWPYINVSTFATSSLHASRLAARGKEESSKAIHQ